MPLVGCGETAGDGKDDRLCVPGDAMECRCDDGSLGLQLCRPDGSGYETCDCYDGAGGAAGAGGEGGAGGSGLGGGGGSPPGESYRTTEELYEELHELAAQHSSIVELVDYGDSYVRQEAGAPSGYDLLALRITAKGVSGPKPVFVIVAGYHGDEVIGTELARRMLHWLVESYDADADATWLVDYHDTWVIPTVSPDTLNVSRSNANLVNLNRNHSFQWVAADGHGERPASEPEVFHLEELLSEKLTDQRGPDEADAAPLDTVGLFITLHASGSIISWPWAFSDAPAPNSAGLATIGRKLGATLGYDTGQTYDAVYPIHGCATDWIYGTFGVPAFLHEIGRSDRPAFGDVNTDIWPPHLEAMLYEARLARAPYQLGAGPDVRNRRDRRSRQWWRAHRRRRANSRPASLGSGGGGHCASAGGRAVRQSNGARDCDHGLGCIADLWSAATHRVRTRPGYRGPLGPTSGDLYHALFQRPNFAERTICLLS
jgi:hypothetical protein